MPAPPGGPRARRRRGLGEVGDGLCVLLGVAAPTGSKKPRSWPARSRALRVFPDDEGRLDRCVRDVRGSALVVSQFTLIANTAKGNRPSFAEAAPPEQAEPLYGRFCAELRTLGIPVETGVFGATMQSSS